MLVVVGVLIIIFTVSLSADYHTTFLKTLPFPPASYHMFASPQLVYKHTYWFAVWLRGTGISNWKWKQKCL